MAGHWETLSLFLPLGIMYILSYFLLFSCPSPYPSLLFLSLSLSPLLFPAFLPLSLPFSLPFLSYGLYPDLLSKPHEVIGEGLSRRLGLEYVVLRLSKIFT